MASDNHILLEFWLGSKIKPGSRSREVCARDSQDFISHNQGPKFLTTTVSTGRPDSMSHSKWRETKQQLNRAKSGHQISCCLVSPFPVRSSCRYPILEWWHLSTKLSFTRNSLADRCTKESHVRPFFSNKTETFFRIEIYSSSSAYIVRLSHWVWMNGVSWGRFHSRRSD